MRSVARNPGRYLIRSWRSGDADGARNTQGNEKDGKHEGGIHRDGQHGDAAGGQSAGSGEIAGRFRHPGRGDEAAGGQAGAHRRVAGRGRRRGGRRLRLHAEHRQLPRRRLRRRRDHARQADEDLRQSGNDGHRRRHRGRAKPWRRRASACSIPRSPAASRGRATRTSRSSPPVRRRSTTGSSRC